MLRRRSECPGSSGVEQRIENPRVGGSNPPPGTIRGKRGFVHVPSPSNIRRQGQDPV